MIFAGDGGRSYKKYGGGVADLYSMSFVNELCVL